MKTQQKYIVSSYNGANVPSPIYLMNTKQNSLMIQLEIVIEKLINMYTSLVARSPFRLSRWPGCQELSPQEL